MNTRGYVWILRARKQIVTPSLETYKLNAEAKAGDTRALDQYCGIRFHELRSHTVTAGSCSPVLTWSQPVVQDLHPVRFVRLGLGV